MVSTDRKKTFFVLDCRWWMDIWKVCCKWVGRNLKTGRSSAIRSMTQTREFYCLTINKCVTRITNSLIIKTRTCINVNTKKHVYDKVQSTKSFLGKLIMTTCLNYEIILLEVLDKLISCLWVKNTSIYFSKTSRFTEWNSPKAEDAASEVELLCHLLTIRLIASPQKSSFFSFLFF